MPKYVNGLDVNWPTDVSVLREQFRRDGIVVTEDMEDNLQSFLELLLYSMIDPPKEELNNSRKAIHLMEGFDLLEEVQQDRMSDMADTLADMLMKLIIQLL